MAPRAQLTTDNRRVRISYVEPADKHYLAQIPGRSYHKAAHCWEIPATTTCINQLRDLLPATHIPEAVLVACELRDDLTGEIAAAKNGAGAWPHDQIDAHPYDHQKVAFDVGSKLLESGESFGIFHEPGCGKTLTCLALISQLEHPASVLVVCPASVISVWEREAKKFCNYDIHIVPLTGSAALRTKILKTERNNTYKGLTLFITNYEILWREQIQGQLIAHPFDVVVCDEAHRLKTPSSKQSIAARKIARGARKIAATGTPVANTLTDWYGIYRWLDDTVFGQSFTAFRDRYFRVFKMGPMAIPIIEGVKPEMHQELTRKAHSLAHACSKAEALDLPDQIDVTRTCDLEPAARRMYNEMKSEAITFLADDTAVLGANTLTRLLRLSQITGGFVKQNDVVTQVSEAKLKLLRETLEDTLAQSEKVVVFARFTAEIDAILALLKKMSVETNLIDGRVPLANRGNMIDSFQEGSSRAMVAQWQAGGVGITLHAAHDMILYSLPESLSDWLQARDRIHRIGQRSVCQYTTLCASGTVDEAILNRLLAKKDVAFASVHMWREVLGV